MGRGVWAYNPIVGVVCQLYHRRVLGGTQWHGKFPGNDGGIPDSGLRMQHYLDGEKSSLLQALRHIVPAKGGLYLPPTLRSVKPVMGWGVERSP
jgi:hypothetical protein